MSLQPGRFEYLERELHAIDDSKKKGDEGGEPLSLYALKQGVLSTIEKGLGPELGPLPSLDDVMVSVSAHWDELSDAEKVVIGLILNRETVEQGATPVSAEPTKV